MAWPPARFARAFSQGVDACVRQGAQVDMVKKCEASVAARI
jgi:hypothetical protein